MNVSELNDLVYWVTQEIVKTQIPKKYQVLQQVLQQNVQPNQKQPFEAQKNDLIEAITKVPLSQLTKEQLLFLQKLGIAQAVGEEGVHVIEDILYKNVIDIATSAKKIQEILQKMNQGIQKADQIKTGLDGCVFEEEYEIEQEVLIRVSFTGLAAMANVTDFKKWGNIWHEIGRGIAMAHNATPEDVRIIGATRGSVIIELATIPTIATTVSMVIFSSLKLAEKILKIRKTAEEIKNLQLQNKKLANELEKEADNEKKSGIEKIFESLVGKLKIKKEGDGDKINALNKAVENLVNFIESGGEVDFVVPEDKDDNSASTPNYEELKIAIKEIRQLESKLKLLEFKSEKSNE